VGGGGGGGHPPDRMARAPRVRPRHSCSFTMRRFLFVLFGCLSQVWLTCSGHPPPPPHNHTKHHNTPNQQTNTNHPKTTTPPPTPTNPPHPPPTHTNPTPPSPKPPPDPHPRTVPWDPPQPYRDQDAAAEPGRKFEAGEEGDSSRRRTSDSRRGPSDDRRAPAGDVTGTFRPKRNCSVSAGLTAGDGSRSSTAGRLSYSEALRGHQAGCRRTTLWCSHPTREVVRLGEHGYVRRFRPGLYEELIPHSAHRPESE